jgi:hypothetical protein
MCPPPAKINVGATLAVGRLVCTLRYYGRVYYFTCTMQSICNVFLENGLLAHHGATMPGWRTIPEHELALEQFAHYGAAILRLASSRSQPCAKVRSSTVSPLASVSVGKSSGRRSVPILQL